LIFRLNKLSNNLLVNIVMVVALVIKPVAHLSTRLILPRQKELIGRRLRVLRKDHSLRNAKKRFVRLSLRPCARSLAISVMAYLPLELTTIAIRNLQYLRRVMSMQMRQAWA